MFICMSDNDDAWQSENDDAWRDYMFEDDINDFNDFDAHDDEKKINE